LICLAELSTATLQRSCSISVLVGYFDAGKLHYAGMIRSALVWITFNARLGRLNPYETLVAKSRFAWMPWDSGRVSAAADAAITPAARRAGPALSTFNA
jgi:hypothetical protein